MENLERLPVLQGREDRAFCGWGAGWGGGGKVALGSRRLQQQLLVPYWHRVLLTIYRESRLHLVIPSLERDIAAR